jgi:lambda family phage portal protein
MNWLDRTIGVVAPATALRRARHRAAIAMLARSYEGARLGRRTEGWVVAGSSANAEIGTALSRLRDRSRDLVRNNPYATKAVQAVVSNLVGTGILPRARSGDASINEAADMLWACFAESCDADQLTDFSGLQALIVRAMAESGECLVRLRERRLEDGLAVPLQLQLLEPDHLDTGKTGDLPGGGFIVQGVEFDPLGRRRAYWMFPVHPGEVAMFRRASLTSQPVPATSVLHLFDRLRPGRCAAHPGSPRSS